MVNLTSLFGTIVALIIARLGYIMFSKFHDYRVSIISFQASFRLSLVSRKIVLLDLNMAASYHRNFPSDGH